MVDLTKLNRENRAKVARHFGSFDFYDKNDLLISHLIREG